MAQSLGEMFVSVGADTSDFDRQMRQLQREVQSATGEMRRSVNGFNRAFGSMGPQAQELSNRMKEFRASSRESLGGFREDMAGVQLKFLDMAEGMKTYSGTNAQFMTDLEGLGKEHKRITDQMIANNDALKIGYITGVSTMLAKSTQSEKIAQNYDRMNNPLLRVNNGLLAITGSMEKMAIQGRASVLALSLLGPTANMKQLQDMTMLITRGLMRYQMVAMSAIIVNALLFSALHKGAMDSVDGYETAFTRMKKAVREAFQPMIDVFGEAMKHVYNFITAVANLVIKFNEAHPLLAKIIQGFLLLIPVLTLLLAPLSIGIGLFAGMSASFSFLWTLIGPLVTGLGAMMGTVLLVAGAIAGLTGLVVYLWKTNESFRESILKGVDALKQFGSFLGGQLAPIIDKVVDVFGNLVNAVQSAINGDFGPLQKIFENLIPTLIGFMVGGIPRLIIAGAQFIPAISDGITSGSQSLVTVINNLISNILQFIVTELPKFIQIGVDLLQKVIDGIVSIVPVFVTVITDTITQVAPLILGLLPVLIQAGMRILEAIINGIVLLLPQLVKTALLLVETIIDLIVKNLPMILDAGMTILMTLINGIMQILPQLITTAVSLITTIVTMLTNNIGLILNMGIKILMTLIEGIVRILPKLIETSINLITQIIKTITENLPSIITAGITILKTLISGIVQILPQLINAIISLVGAIITTVIGNLPLIIKAGWEILKALIKGIVQLISELHKTIKGDVIPQIVDTLKEVDLKEIGKDIIRGLIDGIGSMIGAVANKISEVAGNIKDKITSALDIHSPSRWFRDMVGKNISLGLALGIEDKSDEVMNAMNSVNRGIKSFETPMVSAVHMDGQSSSGGDNHYWTVEINASSLEEVKSINDMFNRLQQEKRARG